MWQAHVSQNGAGVAWAALQDRSLVTEELNPLYHELSSTVTQIELETKALLPRKVLPKPIGVLRRRAPV